MSLPPLKRYLPLGGNERIKAAALVMYRRGLRRKLREGALTQTWRDLSPGELAIAFDTPVLP